MRLEIYQILAGTRVATLSLVGASALLVVTSCNQKQRNASASIPPAATPAAYPGGDGSLFPAQSNDGSYPGSSRENEIAAAGYTPATGSIPKPKPSAYRAPSAPKFKPFVLGSGERLVKHTVVKGDTLTALARSYGTSVSRIQSANGLNGSKILAGKSYKIPTKRTTVPPVSNRSFASPPPPRSTTSVASSPPRTLAPPAPSRPSLINSYKSTTPSYTPPTLTNSPTPTSSRSISAPPSFAPRSNLYQNAQSISNVPSNFGVNPPSSGSSITLPPSSGLGTAIDSGF